jgi:hypothetical protein
MSIEVGDAVLRFIGDTSQLDETFNTLGTKAQAGMKPATDALDDVSDGFKEAGAASEKAATEIEDAGERSSASMREAKGEVALLGEAFGIHLPRHVRSFVAELPGVGEAMSAAFSATAILFLVKALADATEKVSDFAGATFIYTKGMQEAHSQLVAINNNLNESSEMAAKAKNALKELSDVRTPIEKLNDALAANNAEIDRIVMNTEKVGKGTELEVQKRVEALQEQNKLLEAQIVLQDIADKDKSNADKLKDLQQEIELRKKLAEVQVTTAQVVHGLSRDNADEIRYQISVKALQALAAAEQKYGKDSENRVRELNASIEQLQAEHALKTTEELNRQKDETLKLLDGMQKSVKAIGGVDIILPKNMQALLKFREEAKALGITLGVDLTEKINLAKKALADYTEMGGKDAKQIEVLKLKIQELEKEYDKLGQVQNKEKLKSETTWAGFIQDCKKGIDATHELSVNLQSAFNSISSGLQNALAMAIAGEKNYGKALEEATAKALDQLAAQAAVKALFYTAEGFAALAGFAESSAAQYFTAAGEMLAVATAAGIAGRVMGGGGAGSSASSSPFQGRNGASNTSGVGGSATNVVGVQHFATGGLITQPTLAMIGEQSRTEAVLPLENPRAMAQIGKSISESGGGGGFHIHLPHGSIISADVMQKFVAKMNKMVNRGQLHVKSSSSLRLNKRSA